MEYLLVMTLSGSTMTVVYLLLRCLLKKKISARFFDLLARVAVLFYLIPLPHLKKCYMSVLRLFLPEHAMEISRVPLTWRNHIVYTEGMLHVNLYAGIQTAAAVIWMSGVGILLATEVVEYVRLGRMAAGYAEWTMTPHCRAFLDDLKRQYGIRRRVFLFEETAREHHTITFGFFRPVIVCSRDTASPEAELLVRHELVHIKRMDAFWKLLMELAVMLYWCNPLVWILRRDFEEVCEYSCDETAMQNKTDEEVKMYLRLMIEEAMEKKTENVSLRWKAGFGDDAQKIKERTENLMRKKKWNRVAAVALVSVLAFANSMTAFAYREPFEREISEEAAPEVAEEKIQSDTFLFVPEGTEGEALQEFEPSETPEIVQELLYDRQFVDEDGNIYPIGEDDTIEPHCNHTFVSGVAADHIKKSDGGCVVIECYAQRCSKCGYVIEGAEISRTTYVKCPH